MTDRLREAAQAALEALENLHGAKLRSGLTVKTYTYVTELRAALAEPEVEQEPVVWSHNLIDNIIRHRPADIDRHPDRWTPLYTSPLRREWRGLTQEELEAALGLTEYDDLETATYMIAKANSIEAALKEKNT